MDRIFNLDNKLMQFLSKVEQLMRLNMLTLLCCIPIVTIGASFTAMHSVLLKFYRKKEPYIGKAFFKAFKDNFKQATIIWILYFVIGIFLGLDFYFLKTLEMEINPVYMYVLYIITAGFLFSLQWVFVLLSRYENTVKGTIKNSLVTGIVYFYYSIAMLVLFLMPVILCMLSLNNLFWVLLLGISLPGFLQTFFYEKVFRRYENDQNYEDDQDEEEHF